MAKSKTSRLSNSSANPNVAAPLPAWMQDYMIWHKRQRRRYDKEAVEDVKFLVVACLRRTQCGGLSDRVRSMPYWLLLAEKTNRVLLIHWNKKYKLEDFWIPPRRNALDWRLSERWAIRSPFAESCITKPSKVLPEFHDESNPNIESAIASSERVVCVKTRNDMTSLVYDSFGTNYTRHFAISSVFQSMFTPTDELQNYIRTVKREQIGFKIDDERYLAVHIRALYPLETGSGLIFPTWNNHSDMMKAWSNKAIESVIDAYRKHYSDSNGSLPPIYVASDSSDVVDYVLSNNSSSWPTRILALRGTLPRYHLELDTANNSALDMYPTFFDLSMLSHGKCLSFGIGSYGRLSARFSGLQCITQHRDSLQFEDYKLSTDIAVRGSTNELAEAND